MIILQLLSSAVRTPRPTTLLTNPFVMTSGRETVTNMFIILLHRLLRSAAEVDEHREGGHREKSHLESLKVQPQHSFSEVTWFDDGHQYGGADDKV